MAFRSEIQLNFSRSNACHINFWLSRKMQYHHISLQRKASITDSWSLACLFIFLRFVFCRHYPYRIQMCDVWCCLNVNLHLHTRFFLFVTQFWYCINMDFNSPFTFKQFLFFAGDVSSWSVTIIRNFIHGDAIPT